LAREWSGLKSKSIPWTRHFFNKECPCGSGKKSYACCWEGDGRWEKTPVGIVNVSGPPFENDRCYLSPLRCCGAKITKEHFISRNILERITTGTLRFENAGHFFGGKQKVNIGIDDFCAKVLCDNHNSSLSVLDTAAGLAFSTIEALAGRCMDLVSLGRGQTSFHISSGIDIERWMIKVYCGLVAAKKIRSASGKTVQRNALEPYLLNSLIGTTFLPTPLGLYMHTFVGQQLKPGGLSFGTIQLTDGSDEVGGLMLSMGLMSFVLVISPRYDQTFHDPNWRRHQSLAWNIRQGAVRVAYLFTY
jgi:hypothetical protein